MLVKSNPKIALIGNPNSGKSSLFNHLTGLNQKIGNFPGVTVDKKTGRCRIHEFITADLIDLPGTYSLYPKSDDEKIVFDFLTNSNEKLHPDIVIVVVDASNLKRNLLLFSQIRDLGFPVILAVNMMDLAAANGFNLDLDRLSKKLQVPVVPINARSGKGLDKLKMVLANPDFTSHEPYISLDDFAPECIDEISRYIETDNSYLALQYAHQFRNLSNLSPEQKLHIHSILLKNHFNPVVLQSKETISRYEMIENTLKGVLEQKQEDVQVSFTTKADKILTHKVWGYLIFFLVLFVVFQSIFSFAEWPMEMIDTGVWHLKELLQQWLPESPLTDLLTEGVITGLGGILMFIPQIAILSAFISLLEESGYMSRVMFMMDKIMRRFGMNGKSVVPLVSGLACAVPAIMATRSIDSWKDRLITIFVTPFVSCSARLPVYAILISLVVPSITFLGVLNLQGIVLMALYFLGFGIAILSGWIMKVFLKNKEKGYFIMEYPSYKMPRLKNVFYTVYEKVKTFTWEAGKVIMAISMILWVLASYGPGTKIENSQQSITEKALAENWDVDKTSRYINSATLENSYAGHFGRFIEPVIKPLGFDWKIGIAIITSFAAREVFVGTMATIYNVSEEEAEVKTLMERMRQEKDPHTLQPLYTPALGFSILVFYALAMQCMSTLAIVYRETKSWKWPVAQFIYMTAVAYIFSFLTYYFLS